MNILLINNPQERCGVAMYGRLWAEAMRRRGHAVAEWACTPHEPVPAAATCLWAEACFINWMAGTVGFLKPEQLPHALPAALYFHESFPEGNAARCPLWSHVARVFLPEPAESEAVVIPMPAPMAPLFPEPAWEGELVLGTTNLRHLWDGLIRDAARLVTEQVGLRCRVDLGDGRWRSVPEEVERLARCHVLVQVNSGGWGGQSSSVMMAAAARRPLVVLPRARQLSTLAGYADELYHALAETPEAFAFAILQAYADLRVKQARRPDRLLQDRSWDAAARIYEHHLQALKGGAA